MPELPEVEIVRRGLARFMEGAAFTKVELRRPDLRFAFQDGFVQRLECQNILSLKRRAKYILVETANAEALILHLGMTGRFSIGHTGAIEVSGQVEPQNQAPSSFYARSIADPLHDHVVFTLSNGARITYNDVRRFGYMLIVPSSELEEHPLFKGLGPEPLSEAFSPRFLLESAAGKRQSLKGLLLDQRTVAGLGNIYVCEALFDAKLSPLMAASELAGDGFGLPAAQRLCASIKRVLHQALEAGGSSFRDYRHADGAKGSFQDQFAVYGRHGKACISGCGAAILRVAQLGRSTFHCPSCQALPHG